MDKNKENLYYLMSINVIAYIKNSGINEVYKELLPDNKIKYWFENTDRFKQIIEEFKSNKELKQYLHQLKLIKENIHELRKSKGVK